NDCIGTNPDMVPDGDRKGILKPRAALTGIDGVAGGSDAAVWRNEHMISDPDLGAVQNDQMVIGIKMLPNFNVIAIVTVKRGRNYKGSADPADDLPKDLLPFIR